MSLSDDVKHCLRSVGRILVRVEGMERSLTNAPYRDLDILSSVEPLLWSCETKFVLQCVQPTWFNADRTVRRCRLLLDKSLSQHHTLAQIARTFLRVSRLINSVPSSAESVHAISHESFPPDIGGYNSSLPTGDDAQRLQRLDRGFNTDSHSFLSRGSHLSRRSEPDIKPMFMHYTISEDRSGDRESVSRAILAVLRDHSAGDTPVMNHEPDSPEVEKGELSDTDYEVSSDEDFVTDDELKQPSRGKVGGIHEDSQDIAQDPVADLQTDLPQSSAAGDFKSPNQHSPLSSMARKRSRQRIIDPMLQGERFEGLQPQLSPLKPDANIDIRNLRDPEQSLNSNPSIKSHRNPFQNLSTSLQPTPIDPRVSSVEEPINRFEHSETNPLARLARSEHPDSNALAHLARPASDIRGLSLRSREGSERELHLLAR
jgi:hypothetical protein